MYIPTVIKRCVAFVGYAASGGPRVAGTAFFVGVNSTISDKYRMIYLVTAKHCVESIREYMPDGEMFVRLNQHGLGAKSWQCKCSDWIYHPFEEDVDVAAMPMKIEPDFEWGQLPTQIFLTDQIIQEQTIGIGDEIYAVGLFTNHYGKKKNIPIARVGNIAAMPDEPVTLRRKRQGITTDCPIEAYLIEARSMAGLSGSPVFIETDYKEHISPGEWKKTRQSTFYLLGMINGHYDAPYPGEDFVVDDSKGGKGINLGIGVVTPAKKILEVVTQDKLMDRVNTIATKLLSDDAPVMNITF